MLYGQRRRSQNLPGNPVHAVCPSFLSVKHGHYTQLCANQNLLVTKRKMLVSEKKIELEKALRSTMNHVAQPQSKHLDMIATHNGECKLTF